MIEIRNECIDCAADAYPCLGSSCPRRSVTHYYCDECNSEEKLYYFEGQELCINCIADRLETVEGSDAE